MTSTTPPRVAKNKVERVSFDCSNLGQLDIDFLVLAYKRLPFLNRTEIEVLRKIIEG